jgi:uncharacterized surface protein with fasciclin (FAS1) repeats
MPAHPRRHSGFWGESALRSRIRRDIALVATRPFPSVFWNEARAGFDDWRAWRVPSSDRSRRFLATSRLVIVGGASGVQRANPAQELWMKVSNVIGLSFVTALALVAGQAAAQCSGGSKQAKADGCEGDKTAAVTHVAYGDEKGKGGKDIVDTAVAAGSFKTLAAALGAADLVEALKGKGPFTVFAPTDEAFAKLPKGTVETLLKPENKSKLQAILKYHVVSGNVLAKDVKAGSVETLNGQRVDLKTAGGVSVDGAKVTTADVVASNGVIHVIDTVILPSDKTIVETAIGAGSFKTLAKLLETADLVEALSGPGPFTVFAPTDEAFAKLPKETVESLLKPEGRETLTKILKLHVINGRVFSETAAKGATVKTLAGQDLTTKSEGGKVLVGNATVTGADIDASNGVIHVIDTVLLPK